MAAEHLAGTSTEGMKLVLDGIGESHPRRGLVAEIHDRVHKVLSSSSSLESMSRDMSMNIALALNELGSHDGTVVNLSSWVKHAISIVSTNTIYGPMNPFVTDSQVYTAFW